MNRLWQTLLATALLLITSQVSAVDYELPDVNGQMQSLDQYQGKWVIVNYWATWCSTCMKELPDLVSIHEGNKDKDIVVVGINFESIGNDQLKAFVAEQSIPYPVLRSEPLPVTALGKVPALPTTYIIDPDGKVVAGEVGLVTRQSLEDYIAGKKAENAPSS
jgi:peroxiredoxin